MFLNSNYSHEPAHKFDLKGTYCITAATLHKKHLFDTPTKLSLLQSVIFEQSAKFLWELKSWAVFTNHYHLIISNSSCPQNLPLLIRGIHGNSAVMLNKIDNTTGRKVWHQYWDTCLTYSNSYYARINYVMNNPVKHKLVSDARQYQWCSASWFFETAEKQYRDTVLSFKTDFVTIEDDFIPADKSALQETH